MRVGALYVPSAELTPEARDERNARARESAARQAAGTARPREVQGRKEPAPKGVYEPTVLSFIVLSILTVFIVLFWQQTHSALLPMRQQFQGLTYLDLPFAMYTNPK